MKHSRFVKLVAPTIALAALLLSTQAAGQRRSSIESLINSCQQELQTICTRMDEPREAVMCLRENEPQLYTRACIREMRLMNQDRYNYPLPSEQPYRMPEDEREVQ